MTAIVTAIVTAITLPQVLEGRLAHPAYRCGSAELGGLWRGNCRWPFTCCNKNVPRWALDEHGSPPGPPESPGPRRSPRNQNKRKDDGAREEGGSTPKRGKGKVA